jgi:hypothetical protein
MVEESEKGAVILDIEEYRLPLYKIWDEVGYLCPKNEKGWVAYHNELILQQLDCLS